MALTDSFHNGCGICIVDNLRMQDTHQSEVVGVEMG